MVRQCQKVISEANFAVGKVPELLQQFGDVLVEICASVAYVKMEVHWGS